jgi:hypothetical protein
MDLTGILPRPFRSDAVPGLQTKEPNDTFRIESYEEVFILTDGIIPSTATSRPHARNRLIHDILTAHYFLHDPVALLHRHDELAAIRNVSRVGKLLPLSGSKSTA